MSNFVFMNNEQFLKHPSCERIYTYAVLAEQSYWEDHEKCATKVRFVLEQFCIFVSELKQVEYPLKISMLGNYWCQENKFVFLKAFGPQNYEYIKQANKISCSYLHSELIPREDIYPEMLENVYRLLLWLYKELGFKTNYKYSDYNISRIPQNEPVSLETNLDIYYSSEKMMESFQKLYPNCNMDELCSVEKQGECYIVKDLNGNVIDEFVASEKYSSAEDEKKKIQEQVKKISNDFNVERNYFQNEQKMKDNQIEELNNKLHILETQKDQLTAKQRIELQELHNQIARMEFDRQETVDGYNDTIRQMREEYDRLQERYEELVPVEEQREQLQNQLDDLLKERKERLDNFRQKEKKLLEEIEKNKQELYQLQNDVVDMKLSSKESGELISDLKQKLMEKEKELKDTLDISAENYNRLQKETAQKIREYENKANDLEIIITYVMTQNAKYKEMVASQDDTDQAKRYLQVVNQGISQMKEGYLLYQQKNSEETLRKYLLKVKCHYESEISDLKEDLKKKEEELHREKIKNQKMMNDWWDYAESSEEHHPVEHERRKGKRHRKRTLLKSLFWFTILAAAVVGFVAISKISEDQVAKYDEMQFVETFQELPSLSETMSTVELTEEKEIIEKEIVDTETIEKVTTEQEILVEETIENVSESEEESDFVPSKLEELFAEKEWRENTPKAVEEIPGINQELKSFIESEIYVNCFDDFYATLGYLGEAAIYSVSNPKTQIYTVNGADWIRFCWLADKTEPSALIMYTEPSAISSDFNLQTSKTEVVQTLGEPTNIYRDVGWSDFNFFQSKEEVVDYEWVYEKGDYNVNVRFFFSGDKIIDYCQVIIDV